MEKLWRRLKTPAVVFPHGALGVSPGEPVWDLSGGKFGPYAGQVFVGDFSRIVVRASLEKVAGTWQGAAFPFLGRNETAGYVAGARLKAGTTRGVFGADGSFYLAATSGQGAGEDGLQRITWDGRTAPDMLDIKLLARGFRIIFTRPMSAETTSNPENYEINRFRYYYHSTYGSPRIDEVRLAPIKVQPAADGLSVDVTIEDLKPGFVYEFSLPRLQTNGQDFLANPLGYYTVNRLHNGDTSIGGTTRLPLPGENAAGSRDSPVRSQAATLAAGELVYRLYCTACHQPDGRGIPGGAANFVGDNTRLAKSDLELQATIVNGSEAKGMPAFGGTLTVSQRSAVLAYIRAKFGVNTDGSK
jgi:mono/diheme cytochrome c family protein